MPILFLTARDDEIDRVVGLEIRGDDYIVKPFNMRELLARVKARLRMTQIIREQLGATVVCFSDHHFGPKGYELIIDNVLGLKSITSRISRKNISLF